jgi:hypothetical protein
LCRIKPNFPHISRFDATVLTREVHIATYKGEIEAMSYSESSEVEVPEIITLIAKPEGLMHGQTTTVKLALLFIG